MTASQWRAQPGSAEYEMMVKSLLLALERANSYLTIHPESCGIFPGKRRRKDRRKNMRYNETTTERN